MAEVTLMLRAPGLRIRGAGRASAGTRGLGPGISGSPLPSPSLQSQAVSIPEPGFPCDEVGT